MLLYVVLASAVLVMSYAILMHISTNSCYVGGYLKKQGEWFASNKCTMSGTFVNSNSFGCYMGMGLVAAMALLFSPGRSRRDDGEDVDDTPYVSAITGPRVALVAAGLYLLGGLLLSSSRAGLPATFVGLMALGYLLARGRRREDINVKAIIVAVAAIVVVIVVIAGSAFLTKLATFSQAGSVNRLIIWRTALEAIALSPWLGWGLGSFADIYTILQPVEIPIANDLAHSTPLETIVELGIPAALVAFVIVLLPWGVCWRGGRRAASRSYLPAAAFALAAVPILHSLVDFSLQMPAIAFVTSAFLGMGWAQTVGHDEQAPPAEA
jgi:O-antigen ligase